MKTNEERGIIKEETEKRNAKVEALTDEALREVAGGMSEIDEATLNGTVQGHLMNADLAAGKTQNTSLQKNISLLLEMCRNRDYAGIVSKINSMLPTGVYDSSDQAAYDSLGKAKQAIEQSGILQG